MICMSWALRNCICPAMIKIIQITQLWSSEHFLIKQSDRYDGGGGGGGGGGGAACVRPAGGGEE